MGLSSDDTAVAQEGVLGLYAWMETALGKGFSAPPTDLLQEIGVMIATRRKSVLNRALQLARWIFINGSGEQRDLIAQWALRGLRYLIEGLPYDRDHGNEDEVDVPLLRGAAHA